MHRIITPDDVSTQRANRLMSLKIPAGYVVDPACGTGSPLAIISTKLDREGIGIEVNKKRAMVAQKVHQKTLLIVHGSAEDEDLARELTKGKCSVAVFLLDPARPLDGARSSLTDLEPNPKTVLATWHKYFTNNTAILLDLPPRLDFDSRQSIERMVRSFFPNNPLTWERLSQGGGRIDRLVLHVGLSAGEPERITRLLTDGTWGDHSGARESEPTTIHPSMVQLCDTILIVDAVVGESGLWKSWADNVSSDALSWLRTGGRRPLAHLPKGRTVNPYDPFIISAGVVIGIFENPSNIMDNFLEISQLVYAHGLSGPTLKLAISPNDHPILQRKLTNLSSTGNRPSALIRFGTNESSPLALLRLDIQHGV